MTDLRWQLVEDTAADPQGALFDEVVERHIGKGEYRGMEFLHVNARRVINEVPAASRMPFRFTINAYRGCSHACSYCLEGGTPILMADGRTKRLADLVVGDEVYGTVRHGAYRRYVATPVLAHWSTVKPAYRVRLADGTEMLASHDHRFLTERGWKYVAGRMAGSVQRPHLTTNNTLMGVGRLARGPDKDAAYRRGYLCGMIRGDANLASYSFVRAGRSHGDVHRFRLALVDQEALRRTRAYLEDLEIFTHEFQYAPAAGARKPTLAIRASAKAVVAAIREVVEWVPDPPTEWRKGFLAGIFDAEGSFSRGILRIANRDPTMLERTTDCLEALGFASVVERAPATGLVGVRVRGGLREALRFLHTVDPAITRKRSIAGRAVKGAADLRVVDVAPLGVELPMYDMTTGTGDFVANGVISHNCFARPTHEYLGMNAGEDFDRKIVVKINAAERVRAELAPNRWGGDHIAMGTNTDPYQRCEGKYRLTQAIVKELAAARNPFSILTKSTLIVRDLDLLAEGAQVTDVRTNFSIGTLDEDVWKLTEPGTPHPLRRVEAVAKLNAAGVPCGVLVAPVLPGLSDGEDQLEEVVKACVEAGAVSITPILLHLRPGVREHYLGWLAGARPDLLPQYDELYPRSYAPKATQQALSRQVARLVARHGGRTAAPSQTRAVKAQKRPPASTPPRQLSLEV